MNEDQLNQVPQNNETISDPETENKENRSEQEAKELTEEIQSELQELENKTEEFANIAEDENTTPILKDRILSSIQKIGQETTANFKSLMIKTGLPLEIFAGIKAITYIPDNNILQQGSLIDEGNDIALMATGIFIGVKTMQFAIDKLKLHSLKKGVEKEKMGAAFDATILAGQKLDSDDDETNARDTVNLYDELGETIDNVVSANPTRNHHTNMQEVDNSKSKVLLQP